MSIEPFNKEFFGQPLMYQSVNEVNLPTVQNLHRMILPLTFSNPFFKGLLEQNSRSSLFLLGEKAIGFVCFKIKSEYVIYLLSFGLLPVHRGSGIGSFVFDYMIQKIRKEIRPKQIELHVQEVNLKAVKFYQKFGFKIAARLENYYKRLENPAALYLVLEIG